MQGPGFEPRPPPKKKIQYHDQRRQKTERMNKDESMNKLATPKLIAYNVKMPTNNMIKSKLPEYSCSRICNINTQIIDLMID
jgi:hypothetical protein